MMTSTYRYLWHDLGDVLKVIKITEPFDMVNNNFVRLSATRSPLDTDSRQTDKTS